MENKRMCNMFALLVCLSSSTCMAAFVSSAYTRTKQLHSDMVIYWTIENSTLKLGIEVSATGWVGFGIAEAGGMPGADIVYYEAAGNNLVDAYALQYSTPLIDECQDWTLVSGEVVDGKIWVEAERALDTHDEQDWRLFDDAAFHGGNKIIAAWGNTETIGYHSSDRTTGGVTFFGQAEPTDALTAIQSKAGVQSALFAHVNYNIPAVKTTYHYMCVDLATLLNVSPDEAHHILAIEPVIDADTASHVHHFIVDAFYGTRVSNAVKAGSRCAQEQAGDGSMAYSWAAGRAALVFPTGTGFPILGSSGYRSLQLQTHYDNPLFASNLRDSSGIRVWYTRDLQAQDVGVLQIGDPKVELAGWGTIPKGDSKFSFGCTRITQNFNVDHVTVFSRFLHMHTIGQRMTVRQYNSSNELVRFDSCEVYDFNQNGGHNPTSTGAGFRLNKGDWLEVECYYRATQNGVRFGADTEDEMCLDYLSYYPAQPVHSAGSCSINPSQTWRNGGLYFGSEMVASDFERRFGTSCRDRGFHADGLLPFESGGRCSGVTACVRGVAGHAAPTQCGGADGLDELAGALSQCFADAACCDQWPRTVDLWRRLPNLEECQGVLAQDGACSLWQERGTGTAFCPEAIACLDALRVPKNCADVDAAWLASAGWCFEQHDCCNAYPAAVETYRLNKGIAADCQAVAGSQCDDVTYATACPGIAPCVNAALALRPVSSLSSCREWNELRTDLSACFEEFSCCDMWEVSIAMLKTAASSDTDRCDLVDTHPHCPPPPTSSSLSLPPHTSSSAAATSQSPTTSSSAAHPSSTPLHTTSQLPTTSTSAAHPSSTPPRTTSHSPTTSTSAAHPSSTPPHTTSHSPTTSTSAAHHSSTPPHTTSQSPITSTSAAYPSSTPRAPTTTFSPEALSSSPAPPSSSFAPSQTHPSSSSPSMPPVSTHVPMATSRLHPKPASSLAESTSHPIMQHASSSAIASSSISSRETTTPTPSETSNTFYFLPSTALDTSPLDETRVSPTHAGPPSGTLRPEMQSSTTTASTSSSPAVPEATTTRASPPPPTTPAPDSPRPPSTSTASSGVTSSPPSDPQEATPTPVAWTTLQQEEACGSGLSRCIAAAAPQLPAACSDMARPMSDLASCFAERGCCFEWARAVASWQTQLGLSESCDFGACSDQTRAQAAVDVTLAVSLVLFPSRTSLMCVCGHALLSATEADGVLRAG